MSHLSETNNYSSRTLLTVGNSKVSIKVKGATEQIPILMVYFTWLDIEAVANDDVILKLKGKQLQGK